MSVTLDQLAARLDGIERTIRDLRFAVVTPDEPDDLLASSAIDRRYRLREGTAAKHARAGLVRSCVRRLRGRDCYLIPRSEAERLWGAK